MVGSVSGAPQHLTVGASWMLDSNTHFPDGRRVQTARKSRRRELTVTRSAPEQSLVLLSRYPRSKEWRGLASFLGWLVTVGSLILGVLWFLMLGGGKKNTHADESVKMALDPQGGLGITLYIVVTLVLGYLISHLAKKQAERAASVNAGASASASNA